MRSTTTFSPAAAILALVLAAVLPSHAVTIHVPDDQSTIQAGIDAASAGDTVLVACGTYYEHDIEMRSGVCLRSETGQADCVTIDAQELGRVMHCKDVDATAAIRGFTFAHGYVDDDGGGLYCVNSSPAITDCSFSGNEAISLSWGHGGGGVYLSQSSPTLTNVAFTQNSTSGVGANGGGLSCKDASCPTIRACVFSDNSATGGSCGVFCHASSPSFENVTFSDHVGGNGAGMNCMYGSAPVLQGCAFVDNSGGHGGGLRCDDSSIVLTECVFSGNSGMWGGALCCYDTSATLSDVIFSGNTSTSSGGAFYCSNSSMATLTDCVFEGNSGGNGAGLTCHVAEATLVRVLFAGNESSGIGAAIFCTDHSVVTVAESAFLGNSAVGGGAIRLGSYSQCGVQSATFWGNSASESGGALSCGNTSTVTLANAVVSGSVGGEAISCYSGNEVTLTCCDIYGNAGGDWVGCIADQYGVNGNFSEDPLFCLDDNAAEPYSLHEGSPCLPENSPCGQLVGAYPQGCEALTPVGDASWGEIKAMFRQRRSRASTGSQR